MLGGGSCSDSGEQQDVKTPKSIRNQLENQGSKIKAKTLQVLKVKLNINCNFISISNQKQVLI